MYDESQNENNKASQNDINEVFTFSEFINTVKITRSQQDFKFLKPIEGADQGTLELLTPFHFMQLLVQIFYLLYSCSYKRIVPVPQDNDRYLCVCLNTKRLYLCVSQFITEQSSGICKTETKIPYFMYYKSFVNVVHGYWKKVEQKSPPTKRQYLTSDYFQRKLHQISEESPSEQVAFSTFQKEQFFIETSILLRIRNCSLVCVFRKSSQLMLHYKKHSMQEMKLIEEYNEKRRRKTNVEKIFEIQKRIQQNIQLFFQGFKSNPKYYKVEDIKKAQISKSFSSSSYNSPFYGINSHNNTTNKLLIGLKLYELIDLRKSHHHQQQTSSSLTTTTTTTQMMQTQTNVVNVNNTIDQDFYNMYQLQYNSTKNIVIVRMVTDIIMDWATSDSILFKWNTLTFETSNIGLETVQKYDQQKKIKKYVVIRGTSHFNKKQPVLEKILILIDITMATYKSIELQMKSETFFSKNLNRIDQSYDKINHYMKVIYKSCVRSYTSMLKSSSSSSTQKN